MDTTFMNSENSETSNPHRILQSSDKHVASSNLSIYHTQEKIKCHAKNKFKISTLKWNNKF